MTEKKSIGLFQRNDWFNLRFVDQNFFVCFDFYYFVFPFWMKICVLKKKQREDRIVDKARTKTDKETTDRI